MEKTRALVSVKVVKFGHTSRTSVPVQDAELEFDEEIDSYETVYSEVDKNVSLGLEVYTTKTTRPDMKFYVKRTQHAKQAQLVPLTSANWHDMLAKAKTNYSKQKTFDGSFVVRLHMCASREVKQGIRRATPARIEEAAAAIDSYLTQRPDVHVSDITRTHWAISQARQPEGAEVKVTMPDNATFRQMQHLDAMQFATREEDHEESVFSTLTIRPNGFTEKQLIINIQELRAALGLLNYSLIAHGILADFQAPSEPAVNTEDIDHLSD